MAIPFTEKKIISFGNTNNSQRKHFDKTQWSGHLGLLDLVMEVQSLCEHINMDKDKEPVVDLVQCIASNRNKDWVTMEEVTVQN